MSYSIPKRKLSQSGYFWLCWVSGAALALADSGASPSPMFNVGSPMTDKEYQIFIPSPSLRYWRTTVLHNTLALYSTALTDIAIALHRTTYCTTLHSNTLLRLTIHCSALQSFLSAVQWRGRDRLALTPTPYSPSLYTLHFTLYTLNFTL